MKKRTKCRHSALSTIDTIHVRPLCFQLTYDFLEPIPPPSPDLTPLDTPHFTLQQMTPLTLLTVPQ